MMRVNSIHGISVADDFAAIVDRPEPITLRRRGSNRACHVEMAYSIPTTTREATPSGGDMLQSDSVWHVQLPTGEAPARVGDVIVDRWQQRWTVLEVQKLDRLGRFRCVTRELRLANGCVDRVDVERAIWDDIGSGPEIVDWTYVCLALPVKIQLDEMILDTSTDPPAKQLLFDIVLSESIPLEPDDRFTAEDGSTYRLLSLEGADRIDALPVAKAMREEMT